MSRIALDTGGWKPCEEDVQRRRTHVCRGVQELDRKKIGVEWQGDTEAAFSHVCAVIEKGTEIGVLLIEMSALMGCALALE